ncbi:carboxypeptidase s precursor [Atractiella rhizophila]|nr:carboxypeptidase s precursor [Atractiella rhizophila]
MKQKYDGLPIASNVSLPTVTPAQQSRAGKFKVAALGCFLLLFFAFPDSLRGYQTPLWTNHVSTAGALQKVRGCPKPVAAIVPPIDSTFIDADGYRNASAHRLSRLVQIPSISYDDNGKPNEDERWKPFFEIPAYLQDTFPAVFSFATLEKVNTLGLLVTLQGSEASLKPLLLLSHTDVTPVDASTRSQWTKDPFSGYIDEDGKEGRVWGRGAGDDKTLLVAQYEALEALLGSGWRPRRTIILSHGFDEEEVFARQGAGELAKFLERRYGKDSMLMVIDEGSGIAENLYGTPFGLPASSEKGYLDVRISVSVPGGHSSVPPAHTGIGIISSIVTAIEDTPYSPTLELDDPFFGFLQCAAEYAPNFPRDMKELVDSANAAKSVKDARKSLDKLANLFANEGLSNKAMVSTTQAIDTISGGVKVNALPEFISLQMNHRIAFSHSLSYVRSHLEDLIKPIAKQHDLEFVGFDGVGGKAERVVRLETIGVPLEPAPRSPTSGGVWDLLSGTIQHVYPSNQYGKTVVSPYAATGNTDTKVYWNLSRSIFRFTGSAPTTIPMNAHTVDESASIPSHLSIVKWIHSIVQNADLYDGEE